MTARLTKLILDRVHSAVVSMDEGARDLLESERRPSPESDAAGGTY